MFSLEWMFSLDVFMDCVWVNFKTESGAQQVRAGHLAMDKGAETPLSSRMGRVCEKVFKLPPLLLRNRPSPIEQIQ